MSEETNVQMNEATSQEGQTTSSVGDADYKALYMEEVQNAKKLRKRAQEAEFTIQESNKASETEKIRQLKKQEKYKELSENLQKQLDNTMPFKEKWESHEATTRESLLSKLPKKDRESLEGESLKTLSYIVSKLNETKPISPEPSPGAVRNQANIDGKAYGDMTDAEKRAYYVQKAQEQTGFSR